jgi:hypothetical protein
MKQQLIPKLNVIKSSIISQNYQNICTLGEAERAGTNN